MLISLLITMTVYLVILCYSIPAVVARAPGMRLFDMSPAGYSPAYAEKLLSVLGSAGREVYLTRQLPIYFVYPGLFAVAHSLMLVWLWG